MSQDGDCLLHSPEETRRATKVNKDQREQKRGQLDYPTPVIEEYAEIIFTIEWTKKDVRRSGE